MSFLDTPGQPPLETAKLTLVPTGAYNPRHFRGRTAAAPLKAIRCCNSDCLRITIAAAERPRPQ